MGILIAYLLGILTASKPKNQHAGHNTYGPNPAHPQSPSDRPVSVKCIPPTESIEERTAKKKKERREAIKFVVEIVSAIILLLYFGVTVLIWCANKNSAEIAVKELELSQRPWVSLIDITVIRPLVFDSNGAHTTISYAFTNTGHSPAIAGQDLFAFMVPFADNPNPVDKRNSLCKSASLASSIIREKRIGKFFKTWFPGQPQPMTFQVSWNINDIKKAMVDIPKQIDPEGALPLPDYFMPTMVVCVAYRSSFTETQYHTGYILQLVHQDTFKAPRYMERGEIPADELKFVYHPFWAVDAD